MLGGQAMAAASTSAERMDSSTLFMPSMMCPITGEVMGDPVMDPEGNRQIRASLSFLPARFDFAHPDQRYPAAVVLFVTGNHRVQSERG